MASRARSPVRGRLWAAALAALSAGAAPPLAAAARPAGMPLSNETTVTWWAHPGWPAAVRIRPAAGAPVRGRLRMDTEDGFPEVYVALRTAVGPKGRAWYEVRLPTRPNGMTGWVPADALGPLHRVRTRLVIDRTRLRATLYRAGRAVWSAQVGVGAPGTPTPAGRFYVRERVRSLDAFYGPVAFGTSAYSALSDWPGGGVVGIHGTSLPQLIPGRPSHGCVRLRNADIVRLARLMPIGTPVLIR